MAIDSKGFITVQIPIDIRDVKVDEAIQILRDAARGLTDARLDIDCYDDYGSAACETHVRGKRKATQDERKAEEEAQRMSQVSIRQIQDRQIEQLKKQRPEVFK